MEVLINNIKLFYIDEGAGTPLLFLHGNGESCTIFNNSINFFNKKYRTIAIDSRCHGQSEMGNKVLSISVFADDIIEFIEKLGLDDVIIVGFSDGGNIALEVASSRIADKVKKIIVVGANTKFSGLKLWVRIGIRVSYCLFSVLSFMPTYLLKKKYYSIMLHQKEIIGLSKISAETLIIAGDNDMIRSKHTEYIHKNTPNSKVVIIPNCDHFSFKNKNSEINNIIQNFIENKDC